jgi:DNA-binding HxlR family transcriptional regulator
VPAGSLRTNWGPSGGWRRSVPEVRTRRRSGTRSGTKTAQHSFYPDTMAVFGNRWSSAVVGAAFRGITRFTDFQDLLGAPPSLLADRLSSLCERGILVQAQTESRPDWPEYKLTPKGLDFFPVIAIAVEWAEHWYTAHEGPVLTWTHVACGAPFKGVLTCDHCGRPLRGLDIDLDESA